MIKKQEELTETWEPKFSPGQYNILSSSLLFLPSIFFQQGLLEEKHNGSWSLLCFPKLTNNVSLNLLLLVCTVSAQ